MYESLDVYLKIYLPNNETKQVQKGWDKGSNKRLICTGYLIVQSDSLAQIGLRIKQKRQLHLANTVTCIYRCIIKSFNRVRHPPPQNRHCIPYSVKHNIYIGYFNK